MERKDLKTGDEINFFNGEVLVVLLDTAQNGNVCAGENMWFPLDSRPDEMGEWDIVFDNGQSKIDSITRPIMNMDYLRCKKKGEILWNSKINKQTDKK